MIPRTSAMRLIQGTLLAMPGLELSEGRRRMGCVRHLPHDASLEVVHQLAEHGPILSERIQLSLHSIVNHSPAAGRMTLRTDREFRCENSMLVQQKGCSHDACANRTLVYSQRSPG